MIHSDFEPAHTSTSARELSASLMIVLGFAVIFTPWAAGVGVSILVGIVTILTGVAYAMFALAARGTGTFLWRVLVSAAFAIVGVYLLAHPSLEVVTLTLLIAGVFFVEGIAEIASYFVLRLLPQAGVLLLNAIFSIVLAFLIWRNWPSSSAWAIGTLLGVNLISSGMARLLFVTSNEFPRAPTQFSKPNGRLIRSALHRATGKPQS